MHIEKSSLVLVVVLFTFNIRLRIMVVRTRVSLGGSVEGCCGFLMNVNLYNRFMGGVDMADQLRGYYHVRMKCRKFYK